MATLLQLLYLTLTYCLSPLVLIYHYKVSQNYPEMKERWSEFFGFYPSPTLSDVIFIHAASVGELEAVTPLIQKLLKNYPTTPILITTATNNGAIQVKKLFNNSVYHVFLPYDIPFAVNRFFAHFQPKIAIIVETEIWPTLFNTCAKNNIPLLLVNARLSEKSLHNYLKIKSFVGAVLAKVDLLLAQTHTDALRYQALGLDKNKLSILGNNKLDMPIPVQLQAEGLQLKNKLFTDRLVWIIGSTHTHEDDIFIRLYQQLKIHFPTLLLILAPRHEKRFIRVRKLCLASQLTVRSRSSHQPCALETDIFLLDSIGELKLFYAAADCSFVAGSMTPVGGHNILEPALLNIPVMFGPYMANSQQTVAQMLAAKACIQCKTEKDIYEQFTLLMTDAVIKETLINNATRFIQDNRGTVDKTVKAIDRILRR